MVLRPNAEDDTPSVNSSLLLSSTPSPPPPISTSTPLYLNSQITPISHNYTTPSNFEWATNHANHVSNYLGMNSIPHWSSSSNQTEILTKQDPHLGRYANLSETHLNRNPFFRFGSDSSPNQNENKISSILRLGMEKTHELSSINSIMPPLNSSTHWFHNRISSGSNLVEKNETCRFEFGGLTLNQNLLESVNKNRLVRVESVKEKLVVVQPQSNDELKEPDEPVEKKHNQLDLIRKGKSKVEVRSPLKAKGYDEINNAVGESEGERDRSRENEEEQEVEVERSNKDEEPIAGILKTWNLRPRKPVIKPEVKVNIGCSGGGHSRMVMASTRVSKLRSAKSRARPSSKRPVVKEKRGFMFSLTKEEIEHDFILMTGEKPPKKPLKRPNIAQKNLDVLFPGIYLANITHEKYRVNVNPPPLKG